ncbi:hypothetical protein ACFQ22_13690 [Lentilactobacillus raoultii]|uniref:Uncharacterized protein n=1 Tax=Lentilactobacillus raoultii TaxID=1987503 RepID=A0ABW3PK36_9LACO|nr:hypothetical protein [Lentilactobacillus raoultii]
MGFWIMVLSGLIGLTLVRVSFDRHFSNDSRRLWAVLGIILVTFAILLATPWGADMLHM